MSSGQMILLLVFLYGFLPAFIGYHSTIIVEKAPALTFFMSSGLTVLFIMVGATIKWFWR